MGKKINVFAYCLLLLLLNFCYDNIVVRMAP